MNEQPILNRCLSTVKSSRIDVMTKLRMENLLLSVRMPLCVDNVDNGGDAELEDLFAHVQEFCLGASAGGVQGLVNHIRKVQQSSYNS